VADYACRMAMRNVSEEISERAGDQEHSVVVHSGRRLNESVKQRLKRALTVNQARRCILQKTSDVGDVRNVQDFAASASDLDGDFSNQIHPPVSVVQPHAAYRERVRGRPDGSRKLPKAFFVTPTGRLEKVRQFYTP